MKKILLSFLIVMQLAAPSYAAELEPSGTPLRKLQRGFLNIALSPIELLYHIKKENQAESFPPGWLLGMGKGAVASVGRAATGAFEIVTFPMAFQSKYRPILTPEFAWQLLDEFEPEPGKAA